MMARGRLDCILFGAGIAGLWLAARLIARGYDVLLLETGRTGGLQTLASQGIIHGGLKYALLGKLTGSSEALATMPDRWRSCIAGTGELDLRGVRLLSPHQYLWSTESIFSRLAGLFARQTLRSRVTRVAPDERPRPFDHPGFHGDLYRLHEPVLDIPSLVARLTTLVGKRLRRLPEEARVELQAGPAPGLRLLLPDGDELQLDARLLIFVAGAGNAGLLESIGERQIATQRRPLQMVMVRGRLPSLFAHCLGAGVNPRLTITSYPLADDQQLWYLGGELAETGVGKDAEAQIAVARAELQALFPWRPLTETGWATLAIDRAEPKQAEGQRPETAVVMGGEGFLVGWPTKLAFAPLLAEQILDRLQPLGIRPGAPGPGPWQRLSQPPMGQPPWA